MENVKEVKIFSAQDNLQAEMILQTFKANQIVAFKRDASEGGFMNLYGGNSMCGEDIYIAEADVEKAKNILEGMGLIF